jgi:short subunit fatty acids transporter
MAADEFEKKAKEFDVSGAIVTSIVTALSLTVGLFWKDVITHTISKVLPDEQTLLYEYMAAMLLTVIAVVVSYILLKTHEHTKKMQLEQRKTMLRKIRELEKKSRTSHKKLIKRLGKRV